jgi:hypothetical protein
MKKQPSVQFEIIFFRSNFGQKKSLTLKGREPEPRFLTLKTRDPHNTEFYHVINMGARSPKVNNVYHM